MKIVKSTKTIFIKADSSEEFDQIVNDSMKGLIDPQLQIYGLYEGAITYQDIAVEDEEQKTIADLFEEAGCGAKCGECPFYQKPTDGRVKYTVCGSRKVSAGSRACDDYYLGRRGNVSAFRREDEGTRMGRRATGGLPGGVVADSVQQASRQDEVQSA